MSEYRAVIDWTHSRGDFLKGTYSREHTWTFDGGVVVPASPAPTSVPAPYSNAAHVDPEEAYVAALSSCHMLTFLHLASKRGFEVASYRDEAVGVMTKNRAVRCGSVPLFCILASLTTAMRLRGMKRTNCITRRTRSATSRIPSRPRSASRQ